MSGRTLKLLLTFSLAFNAAFVAVAIHSRLARGPVPGPAGKADLDEPFSPWAQVDLTEEQQARIEVQRRGLQDRVADIMEANSRERERLLELFQAEHPDREAIRQTQRRIGQNQARLRELAVGHLLKAGEQLSVEQRKKLACVLKDYAYARARGLRGRMGRGMPRWRKAGPGLLTGLDLLATRDDATVTVERTADGVAVHVRSLDPGAVRQIQDEVPTYFRELSNSGVGGPDVPGPQRKGERR